MMLLVVCGVHNLLAADFLEGHSYVARLTKEENLLLVDMSKSMARPKEILVTDESLNVPFKLLNDDLVTHWNAII